MWKGMFVVVKMEGCGRGSLGGEQREGDWMSVVMWRDQQRRHLVRPDEEDGLGPLWAPHGTNRFTWGRGARM